MRLVLVDPFLIAGGAQRVMSLMANHWAAKGWKITLLTYGDATVPLFYEIDQRVEHVPLDLAQVSRNFTAGIWNNFGRIVKLRSAIKKAAPDVTISFGQQNNVVTLLATRGLNIPAIVSERVDPAGRRISAVWDRARSWMYPRASSIVVQTQRAADFFEPRLQSRVSVIPNAVISPHHEHSVKNHLIKPAIVAVGRLHPQKGFDLLLKAFASLKEIHPEWTLTILGEGPARKELEALRDQLRLADRVHLPGRVEDPHAYLREADLYVLSSRFEGFPNALGEAMACGLPVIATDCPSGPGEIIRDGLDGLLVPNGDVPALAAAMRRLMSDKDERNRLAARAREVLERFDKDSVLKSWEELLIQAANNHQRSSIGSNG